MPPTKFRVCYASMLAGEQPWEHGSPPAPGTGVAGARRSSLGKSNAAPRTQFYMDLLCLPVEMDVVVQLLATVPEHVLLDEQHTATRENISQLWKEALRTWREDGDDQVRRRNALDTLVALAHGVMVKPFQNYTMNVVTVLAGGMDEADDVFYALIAAIDDALNAPVVPNTSAAAAQRRALHLALVLTACAGSTSLASYFLHRDLLASALLLMRRNAASPDVVAEAALFISLLATAGHAPVAAPSEALAIAAVGVQPYQRRLREHADDACMADVAPALCAQLHKCIASYTVTDRVPGAGWVPGWSAVAAGPSSLNGTNGTVPAALAASPLAPPPAAVQLLTLWVLIHVAPPFIHAAAAPARGEPLLVAFLSFASYLLTHGASSSRAAAYAHLALQLCLAMLSEDLPSRALRDALLADDLPAEVAAKPGGAPVRIDQVALCRHRAHALPPRARSGMKRPRRLLVAVLENVTLFLRCNLCKRLDLSAFCTALRVVQRACAACAAQRVLLEYDWMDLWRAVLNTCAFLVQRHAELGAPAEELGALAQALLDTLALALAHSDRYLQTPAETHLLVYEAARFAETLRKTAALLPPGGGARATAGWRLLSEVLAAVDARLAAWREGQRSGASFLTAWTTRSRAPSAAEIMHIIQEVPLEALLAPDSPVCAPLLQAQPRRSAKPASIPQLRAGFTRRVKQDVLDMLLLPQHVEGVEAA